MTIALGIVLAAASVAAEPRLPCELHLFATNYETARKPKGNALVRALPASADPLAPVNATNPQARMAEVSQSAYRDHLLLQSDVSVISHWDEGITENVRKGVRPLANVPGRCHAELIGYSSSGFRSGRALTVEIDFAYRVYDGGGRLVIDLEGSGQGFPIATGKLGRGEALDSLRAASQAIIADFGKDVRRQIMVTEKER